MTIERKQNSIYFKIENIATCIFIIHFSNLLFCTYVWLNSVFFLPNKYFKLIMNSFLLHLFINIFLFGQLCCERRQCLPAAIEYRQVELRSVRIRLKWVLELVVLWKVDLLSRIFLGSKPSQGVYLCAGEFKCFSPLSSETNKRFGETNNLSCTIKICKLLQTRDNLKNKQPLPQTQNRR